MQPCMESLAPQGIGERHRDKHWVGGSQAAFLWMLCSGKGQWDQVGLGPWLSRSLRRGLMCAVRLHGLVSL